MHVYRVIVYIPLTLHWRKQLAMPAMWRRLEKRRTMTSCLSCLLMKNRTLVSYEYLLIQSQGPVDAVSQSYCHDLKCYLIIAYRSTPLCQSSKIIFCDLKPLANVKKSNLVSSSDCTQCCKCKLSDIKYKNKLLFLLQKQLKQWQTSH